MLQRLVEWDHVSWTHLELFKMFFFKSFILVGGGQGRPKNIQTCRVAGTDIFRFFFQKVVEKQLRWQETRCLCNGCAEVCGEAPRVGGNLHKRVNHPSWSSAEVQPRGRAATWARME